MQFLLVLPVVIPQATAILALLFRRRVVVQRAISLLGALGLLIASSVLLFEVWQGGIQATQMGGWAAPFGITLVADLLSAGLVLVTALVAVAVVLYSFDGLGADREKFGFHPLLHLLLMGVCGAFITGDIFNLYVWFEVLLIASFVLLVLGNEKPQLDGAVKYVGINLISSVSFLAAIGLLFGVTGTLNMADLSTTLSEMEGFRGSGLEAALASLFLIGFGIKAAIFPLYFWLPASYHTPPAVIGAVFAGLLTKVGIYSIVRLFTIVFAFPTGYTQWVLLVLAGLTMLVGVVGALVQRDLQRLLAFLVISAMGYILMGLAFYSEMGLAGTVFYTLQDVITKALLFLLAGLMVRATGVRTIDQMGGLYEHRPLLATIFIVPAFSLAGFPPFPGFWGKVALLRAGLEAEQWLLVAVALGVGLLTLLVVGQVWARAFWREAPNEVAEGEEASVVKVVWSRALDAPVVALALVLLALGLYARPLYGIAERAAAHLIDPSLYIQAVLGT